MPCPLRSEPLRRCALGRYAVAPLCRCALGRYAVAPLCRCAFTSYLTNLNYFPISSITFELKKQNYFFLFASDKKLSFESFSILLINK
jgi:hypothetical protein